MVGFQEHLVNIFLAEAAGRIWVNHPGEGTLFGHGRPGYFNGNGLTPLMEQQQNVAVMSFCFPEEMRARTEVSYTHAVCNTEFCDEFILEDHWLFIRKKEAYAALYSTNGLQESKIPFLRKSEFVSPGINGAWFIKVSCAEEIGGFSEFQSYMKGHAPEIQDGVLQYQDYEFGEMKFVLMKEL